MSVRFFTITDITKHYVVDQRAKRFELEEDFYDELSESLHQQTNKKTYQIQNRL